MPRPLTDSLQTAADGQSDFRHPGGSEAEIPSPRCIGSSPFLPSIRYVRSEFTTAYHPTKLWRRPNALVQVTGVGFFDCIHGQSGVAPNGAS